MLPRNRWPSNATCAPLSDKLNSPRTTLSHSLTSCMSRSGLITASKSRIRSWAGVPWRNSRKLRNHAMLARPKPAMSSAFWAPAISAMMVMTSTSPNSWRLPRSPRQSRSAEETLRSSRIMSLVVTGIYRRSSVCGKLVDRGEDYLSTESAVGDLAIALVVNSSQLDAKARHVDDLHLRAGRAPRAFPIGSPVWRPPHHARTTAPPLV